MIGFYYNTKIGRIGIVENGSSITHLFFGDIGLVDIKISETYLINKAFTQLSEYLDGKRRIFDLPLEPEGTNFQKMVWSELLKIPYGIKCSYKEIAKRVGNEKACRAIGMANNKNPIAIFIPCHRVIGTNGRLIGYAGGIDLKEKLLSLEGDFCV